MVRWLAAAHNTKQNGGQPLKNTKTKDIVSAPTIEMDIQGVKVTISFAGEEVPGVKGKIIEIITDSYEKKRINGRENNQVKTK